MTGAPAPAEAVALEKWNGEDIAAGLYSKHWLESDTTVEQTQLDAASPLVPTEDWESILNQEEFGSVVFSSSPPHDGYREDGLRYLTNTQDIITLGWSSQPGDPLLDLY